MKTLTPSIPATLAFAKGLFTRGTDAFGPEEIDRVFGLKLGPIPPIPFTEAELKRARELGQYLILQADRTKHDYPRMMKSITEMLGNALGDGKLLYDTDWYAKEPFYTDDTPRMGWALVSREVIPASVNKDYLRQTQAIADYLVNEVYKDEELPAEYHVAVTEWNDRKEELEKLDDTDWKKCAEGLVSLRLNILFREKPVEVLYGRVVQHQVNRERLLEAMYTWTNQRSSYGDLVDVGSCDPAGVSVRSGEPGYSGSGLGVRFFRSGSVNLES
jgi:hypothetical protein